MDLFLIRHAIAVERTSIMQDAMRPLSERGVERFTQTVQGFAALELRLDHVFHSPWLRAVQTAELLAPVTAGKLEATNHLADDPGTELIGLTAPFADAARIAFVGHEPWMGEFLSLLLTGATHYANRFPFKKGAVAWVNGTPGPGKMTLRALFPPKSLRHLGGHLDLRAHGRTP